MAQAIDCASLPAADGDQGYRHRVNRCEGMYVSPISSGEFELLSLVVGGLAFDLNSDESIVISAPAQGDTLRVRAVAREPRVYYRMDAIVAPGEELQWPVDEVLRPEQLSAERIGIFGWTVEAGDTVFVPLRIRDRGARAPGDSIELVVRPSFDADSVVWRTTTGTESSPWRLAARRTRAWRPISIWVHQAAEPTITVRLQALHRHSGRWVTFAITARPRP